ncbi:MAG: hypothetical protein K2H97_02280, partial [Prevotella sp.]|nr:hypothetical protein [Prevotella sp.]
MSVIGRHWQTLADIGGHWRTLFVEFDAIDTAGTTRQQLRINADFRVFGGSKRMVCRLQTVPLEASNGDVPFPLPPSPL